MVKVLQGGSFSPGSSDGSNPFGMTEIGVPVIFLRASASPSETVITRSAWRQRRRSCRRKNDRLYHEPKCCTFKQSRISAAQGIRVAREASKARVKGVSGSEVA